MSLSQVHYLPLAPPFFIILVGLFVIVLVLIQLGVLRYAYMRLGINPGAALLLLFASLIGSYFNIPVAYLPEQRVLAQQEIDFFGMRYVVPFVAQWPGTLIAVNVGGAVIPTLMSTYLLVRNQLWVQAALATVAVAAVCYWLSRPIPGLGIADHSSFRRSSRPSRSSDQRPLCVGIVPVFAATGVGNLGTWEDDRKSVQSCGH